MDFKPYKDVFSHATHDTKILNSKKRRKNSSSSFSSFSSSSSSSFSSPYSSSTSFSSSSSQKSENKCSSEKNIEDINFNLENNKNSKQKIKNFKPILKKFSHLYKSNEFSDIKLIFVTPNNQRHEFFCHKLLLCLSSDVFKIMLTRQSWVESDSSEVVLNETQKPRKIFKNFIKYIYVSKITMTRKLALHYLELADKYNIEDLQRVCIKYMIDNMNSCVKDLLVLHWLNYSFFSPHEFFKDKCLKFITHNFHKVSSCQSFSLLGRELMLVLLKEENLILPSEYYLFQVLVKWLLTGKNHLFLNILFEKEENELFYLIKNSENEKTIFNKNKKTKEIDEKNIKTKKNEVENMFAKNPQNHMSTINNYNTNNYNNFSNHEKNINYKKNNFNNNNHENKKSNKNKITETNIIKSIREFFSEIKFILIPKNILNSLLFEINQFIQDIDQVDLNHDVFITIKNEKKNDQNFESDLNNNKQNNGFNKNVINAKSCISLTNSTSGSSFINNSTSLTLSCHSPSYPSASSLSLNSTQSSSSFVFPFSSLSNSSHSFLSSSYSSSYSRSNNTNVASLFTSLKYIFKKKYKTHQWIWNQRSKNEQKNKDNQISNQRDKQKDFFKFLKSDKSQKRNLFLLFISIRHYIIDALLFQEFMIVNDYEGMRKLIRENRIKERHLVLRNYTSDIWCTKLNVDHLPSLKKYEVRSVVFPSPSNPVLPERGQWGWVADLYPKGVMFDKFYLIGLLRKQCLPGKIYETIRLTLKTNNITSNSNNNNNNNNNNNDILTMKRKLTIVIMITAVQNNIEFISNVIEKEFIFDEDNSIKIINDLIPFILINNDKNYKNNNSFQNDDFSEEDINNNLDNDEENRNFNHHHEGEFSDDKKYDYNYSYNSGPRGESFKISIIIKPHFDLYQ